LPCAGPKTHGKDAFFAVRRGTKMHGNKCTFDVRPYKRTARTLFLLLVLVTLPCVFRKTHGKVAIAFFVFHI
jgi:hypothetical protein